MVMANFEKLYQSVAEQVVQRCHGAIKITKHGKIIEVYDTRRHIWSDGLAGLIIKEESKNANLRDWEVARCIRPRIISLLLEDKKGLLSTRLAPDSAENQTRKRLSKKKFTVKKPTANKHTTKKPIRRKSNQ
jgi:topoisomerase IA-like protein